jgi:hypothetical protein
VTGERERERERERESKPEIPIKVGEVAGFTNNLLSRGNRYQMRSEKKRWRENENKGKT